MRFSNLHVVKDRYDVIMIKTHTPALCRCATNTRERFDHKELRPKSWEDHRKLVAYWYDARTSSCRIYDHCLNDTHCSNMALVVACEQRGVRSGGPRIGH